jgi:hypothetical protein
MNLEAEGLDGLAGARAAASRPGSPAKSPTLLIAARS